MRMETEFVAVLDTRLFQTKDVKYHSCRKEMQKSERVRQKAQTTSNTEQIQMNLHLGK